MIDSGFIYDYLIETFPDGTVAAGGNEFVMPSVFLDYDPKKHMSVNIESGLWQCFKSKQQGNFVKLFAHAEGISPQAAYSKLIFRNIESGNLWEEKKPVPVSVVEGGFDTSDFEPLTPESDLSDPLVRQALTVLYERGLFPQRDDEYYVARKGKYAGRLILPYKDEYGELYFFQARALSHDQFPKYLNPGRNEGVRASDILFPFSYDTDRFQYLYVTEGPSDALTLQRCGFNATCTNGSHVSMAQAEQLKESGMKIIMAFDSDEAGKAGVEKFNKDRRMYRIPELYTVSPPPGMDWNSMYTQKGEVFLIDHITYEHTELDDFTILKQKLEDLFSE